MKITINKDIIDIQKPTTLEKIAQTYFPDQDIYAAIINGKLYELHHEIHDDVSIEWIKANSMIGKQIYERTLTFLFIVATKQLFPDARIRVEFAFQEGLYCTIQKDDYLTPQDTSQIKQRMEELVQAKCIITRHQLSKNQAISFFQQHHLEDKADLLS